MSNLEVICRLCDLLDRAQQIIRQRLLQVDMSTAHSLAHHLAHEIVVYDFSQIVIERRAACQWRV